MATTRSFSTCMGVADSTPRPSASTTHRAAEFGPCDTHGGRALSPLSALCSHIGGLRVAASYFDVDGTLVSTNLVQPTLYYLANLGTPAQVLEVSGARCSRPRHGPGRGA